MFPFGEIISRFFRLTWLQIANLVGSETVTAYGS